MASLLGATIAYFQEHGFLHSRAQLGADVTLVVIVVTAVLFTIGWRLAVHRRFEAHRWVMTVAVLPNAAVVLAWMIRSLVLYVIPVIPARLDERAYALNAVHAVIGIIAVALGVFVTLRGNELVPAALKFSNYKGFMRPAYTLYMLATASGVILYLVAYVDHLM
jgi:uncharacterized membrane protein YozB (DUF420 family)